MVTKGYLIRGAYDGERYHRNKESFYPSYYHDATGYREGDGIRLLRILNSDILGTNDYNIVIITRETATQCDDEMFGQWSDGIFENCNVESPTELEADEVQKYIDMFDLYNRHRFEDVSNINKAISELDGLTVLIKGLSSEIKENIIKEYGEYYFSGLMLHIGYMEKVLRSRLDIAEKQRDETNYTR
jgi:hypothetical protein